jgi:metal-sulfur cluster biosynthetic enzyme
VPNAHQLSVRIVVTPVLIALGILIIILPSWLKRGRLPALTAVTTFTDSADVPDGTPPPDSGAVTSALGGVIDPEIGISIVDLGLVDSLHIDSLGNVNIAIALTTPECPVISQIGRQTAEAIIAVPGVRRIRVRLDPTLPWDPSRLSPAAKELYRKRFGFGYH